MKLLQSNTGCHQLPSDTNLLSAPTCNHLPLVYLRGLHLTKNKACIFWILWEMSTQSQVHSHYGMQYMQAWSRRRGFPKKESSTKGLLLHTEEMHRHRTRLFCFRTGKVSCLKIWAELMYQLWVQVWSDSSNFPTIGQAVKTNEVIKTNHLGKQDLSLYLS